MSEPRQELPQIWRGIPEAGYNELPGLRATALKAFAQSGVNGVSAVSEQKRTTGTLALGNALHAALLEPERYAAAWVEMKGLKSGAVANTWAKAEAEAAADDCYPMAEGWGEYIAAMRDAVMSHPTAGRVMRALSEREISCAWQDDGLGVTGKARIDGIADTRAGRILVDIKTTAKTDIGGFERAAHDYGYHVQAAWYMRAAEMCGLAEKNCGFVFIAVYKDPIDVVVFEPSDDFIRQGRVDCERAIANWKHWKETGEATGLARTPLPLGLPKWASDDAQPKEIW